MLTHCILMSSSYWFDTTDLGWSIVYIQGCPVIIFKKCLNSKIDIKCVTIIILLILLEAILGSIVSAYFLNQEDY